MSFRSPKGKKIAFVMAIIMIFTIYGGPGMSKVFAAPQDGQDTAVTDQIDDQDQKPEEEMTAPGSSLRDYPPPSGTEKSVLPAKGAASAKGKTRLAENAPGDAALELKIVSVEVLTSPEIQALYRDSVYQGVAANGEDPDKWYTTARTINVREPRIFHFQTTVDAATVGNDPDAFLATVKLMYGGFDLSAWATDDKHGMGHENNLRGTKYPILKEEDKTITKNTDGSYTISISMRTELMWSRKDQSLPNVPYPLYGGGEQLYEFSDGQSADNRWWWQIGPAYKGMGAYSMDLMAGETVLASREMNIQQYDYERSWLAINEFAQSLVKALNGSEFPKSEIAKKVTGTIAKGYVARDADGNYVKGTRDDNVWVEVSILGYGLTDNDKPENRGYNNYARYNAIWNVVVAQDESKVDTYLNETKPAMNEHPQTLIDKYSGMDAKDIDMINVFYMNNVHPDEVTGNDTEMKLIEDLIDGGKAGKKIDYKTWTSDDMDFRYRDPAEGYPESEEGHVVKGGYSGRWAQADTRVRKQFDTREALDNLIFVSTICSNPDARAGMKRTNRYDFDLNRDAVFSTMPETIALMRDIMKWDPLIEDEWHGYVQEMLIEPCTAPHDPAFDYDLLANNMRNLTYAAGMAVTASTGYDNFLVPWDHYNGGDWDDGGTIYSPMFAELLGCCGYTIEFPDANNDSFEAGNAIVYAQVDELLHGVTEYFGGNRLNGPLKDIKGNMRDSHEVDIKYSEMKKSVILSKLETKQRGIDNVDSMAADKYFIDKKPILDKDGKKVRTGTSLWGDPVYKTEDLVVGRARPVDESGNVLSFFPDYIVIPKGELQYNIAEGIKAINQMIDWGVKVDVSTADVTYDGKLIPAGSYVISMNQALRNVIFEVMSKGYDATGFDSMYADIYCNLPDVRGFDSIQAYGRDLFKGKTRAVDGKIKKRANISGPADEFIVFDSQSTDAVRFVNHLLAKGEDVWMLKRDVPGLGTASDYMIRSEDLGELNKVKNDPVIGQGGIELQGQYAADLPGEAAKLVEPVISLNTIRTSQSGGPLWYMLDDYLGFGSMKDSEYNGSKTLREGANVIIANNTGKEAVPSMLDPVDEFDDSWVDAIKSGQAGVVFIRKAGGLEKLGVSAPDERGAFMDVAVNGTYNVDDSLYTAEYAKTSTYYARGRYYSQLPEGSKVLFRSLEEGEDAFIGGFQPTDGNKGIFGDKVTMFSTRLEGEDFARPIDAVVIGQYIDYRSHYQKLLPMLATAIYASAAGITDEVYMPQLDDIEISGDGFVSLEVPADAASMTISRVKEDGSVVPVASGDSGTLEFKTELSEGFTLKIVTEDKYGRKFEKTCVYSEKAGAFVDQADYRAPVSKEVTKSIEEATAAIESGKYKDDSTAQIQKALDALNAVIAQPHPSEAQIDEAKSNLDEAVRRAQTNKKDRSSISFTNAQKTKIYDGKAFTLNKRDVRVTYSTGAITFKYYKNEKCTKQIDAPVNAGTCYAKAFVAADRDTLASETIIPAKLVIKKAPQSVKKFSPVKKKIKAKRLKKSKAAYRLHAVASGKGKLTFRKKSGNGKITISKGGKVTVKKGLKKGKYKVKVTVKIASTRNYAASSVVKTITVIVK